MQQKKFNSEYFNLWKEFGYFAFLGILPQDRIREKSGRILIVAPCLIGEFAAAIPAIFDFIERNKDKKVDLLVNPVLKDIAERIAGVGSVFLTSSIYGRECDELHCDDQLSGSYERIIVLRMSRQAYETVKAAESAFVQTPFWPLIGYTIHLVYSMLLRRTPKRWRTFNFELLKGNDRHIPFEAMFSFSEEDRKRVADLKLPKRGVIIHTGTNWPMKHWAKEKWVALLRKIHAEFPDISAIFIGGSEDAEDYEYISSSVDFKVTSLIRKTSLVDLLLIMHAAEVFIGIDSGPSNLAHLADLRSVTIFGPGPHMYMPTDPRDIALDKSDGRGISQLFFSVGKNSLIECIAADEAFEAFRKLKIS
ncbi:MAG: putative lipopolysaccharide heptosyltransferase [Candidatus Taylorbacteria bacterium]|nr:putative lipopolysaccharide heptosyltransferase [Candidatus Taylorbacteria bacterium]